MDENAIMVIGGNQLSQNFVPQLADRLSKALANSGHLELDGNNQFHHYQYPTVAQVRGHANKALSAAGLGIIPEITQEGRTTRETDKGKVSNITFVKLAIHVFAPEGMFTVRWVGESEDMTDKGLAKAVSAGIKTFLLAMMLMPVGEEENDDGEVDAKKASAKKLPAPRTTTKPTEVEPQPSQKWPDDIISWAVDKWSAIKTYQVVGALNQSKVLKPDMPQSDIMHWLEIRKVERDNGAQSEIASEFADADYIATHEQVQSE